MTKIVDPWMSSLPDAARDLTQDLKLAAGDLTPELTCLRVHQADQLLPVLSLLRHDPRHHYRQMIDVCGVDDPGRALRFDVVYHLLSLRYNRRIRVKVATSAERPVPSVTSIFPAAGWWEREAYDMYGIIFSDHPDLRRILTDYEFEGYPLRKDFPLTGFTQVRYDSEHHMIVTEPVNLAQPYRDFDYVGPWKGCLDTPGTHHD